MCVLSQIMNHVPFGWRIWVGLLQLGRPQSVKGVHGPYGEFARCSGEPAAGAGASGAGLTSAAPLLLQFAGLPVPSPMCHSAQRCSSGT